MIGWSANTTCCFQYMIQNLQPILIAKAQHRDFSQRHFVAAFIPAVKELHSPEANV